MLGMASGLFIVPILTMFFHIDMHAAIGTSIVSVIACSCGGAAAFLRGGLTNVRLAVVLETGTTLGALTGVLVAGIVPVAALDFLFAGVLLCQRGRCSCAAKIRRACAARFHRQDWPPRSVSHSSYPDTHAAPRRRV